MAKKHLFLFRKEHVCRAAGFYPSILRVDHPPQVYKKVLGGAMEVEASPIRLKFFDRTKGVFSFL